MDSIRNEQWRVISIRSMSWDNLRNRPYINKFKLKYLVILDLFRSWFCVL